MPDKGIRTGMLRVRASSSILPTIAKQELSTIDSQMIVTRVCPTSLFSCVDSCFRIARSFIGRAYYRLVYSQPSTPSSQLMLRHTRSEIQAQRRQTSPELFSTLSIPPSFRKEIASTSLPCGRDPPGNNASPLIYCSQVSCSLSSPHSWRRLQNNGSCGTSKTQKPRSPHAAGNANASAMVSIGGYSRPSSTDSPCYSRLLLSSSGQA